MKVEESSGDCRGVRTTLSRQGDDNLALANAPLHARGLSIPQTTARVSWISISHRPYAGAVFTLNVLCHAL
jgi:hypothetical protein